MKQFAICLGVFVILLLNVMELLCVVGGALLDTGLAKFDWKVVAKYSNLVAQQCLLFA